MGATAVTEVAIDSQERADSMISCCLAIFVQSWPHKQPHTTCGSIADSRRGVERFTVPLAANVVVKCGETYHPVAVLGWTGVESVGMP